VHFDLRPFAVVLLLAGCATPPTGASPATIPASPTGPAVSSTLEPSGLITLTARTAFLAALARIDRRLATDHPRQLRRAVSSCYELYAGKPEAVRLKNVGLRYHAPKKAKQIYRPLFTWICSSKALRSHYAGMTGGVPKQKPKPGPMAAPSALPNPLPPSAKAAPIHPGSRCGPAGAFGTAQGHVYTCQGPGPLRWRR
jgi:hypothetical protein